MYYLNFVKISSRYSIKSDVLINSFLYVSLFARIFDAFFIALKNKTLGLLTSLFDNKGHTESARKSLIIRILSSKILGK